MIVELSRDQWGAGPLGSGHIVPLAQFVGLVVHHTVIVMPDYDHDGMTGGDVDDAITYMRQLQHARPDLGDEVPYSFVVFEGVTSTDCIVAEGRGLGVTGAHTIGYNSTRYGVAFAGDFTNHSPTPGMWAGVNYVGRLLENPAAAERTLEHRDVYATQCPGNSTASPAPDLAQPPFPFPHPQPSPVEDIVKATYVKRPDTTSKAVYAAFDNGMFIAVDPAHELSFTALEDHYKATLGVQFVDFPVAQYPQGYATIEQIGGRNVRVFDDVIADALRIPR